MSNALLVTTVHVKMKLGDNALNNERLSLVMTKLPIKKVTNCKLRDDTKFLKCAVPWEQALFGKGRRHF